MFEIKLWTGQSIGKYGAELRCKDFRYLIFIPDLLQVLAHYNPSLLRDAKHGSAGLTDDDN